MEEYTWAEERAPRRQAGWQGRAPIVAGGLAVAGVVAVAVLVWPGGGSGEPAGSGDVSKAATAGVSPSASPSPSRSYPLSKAPRTIPAVREHTAAHGPGWRPASGGRVVVDDAGLADEGKLLAGELKLTYAGRDDPRDGDVEL
ncbi:beta-N-acetylglucosaminidase, partial [Streptomyces sp. NPDC127574]